MKELISDEPYEVAPGCPTLTFNLGNESLMFPYSSFTSGKFKKDSIELMFQEWRVEIEGNYLLDLWKLLQLQEIRSLKLSSNTSAAIEQGCNVKIIRIMKMLSE